MSVYPSGQSAIGYKSDGSGHGIWMSLNKNNPNQLAFGEDGFGYSGDPIATKQ
jgi:hypothetical protein